MTAAARRLLDDALTLPDADRAEVAGALAESVPADAVMPDPPGEETSPAEHRAAWAAELDKRAAGLDSGEVRAIPRDEAERRIFGSRNAARLSPRSRRRGAGGVRV